MREILFRAKRTDNGEWVEGYYLHQRESLTDKKACYIATNNGYGFKYKSVLPETVGQYTGLTDKNGRKIFEGDIVRCYYSDIAPFTGEIEAYEKEVLIDDIRRSEVIGWIDCADELEIIGNIYDNPELLEVKK